MHFTLVNIIALLGAIAVAETGYAVDNTSLTGTVTTTLDTADGTEVVTIIAPTRTVYASSTGVCESMFHACVTAGYTKLGGANYAACTSSSEHCERTHYTTLTGSTATGYTTRAPIPVVTSTTHATVTYTHLVSSLVSGHSQPGTPTSFTKPPVASYTGAAGNVAAGLGPVAAAALAVLMI